jgi:hypothetical protein
MTTKREEERLWKRFKEKWIAALRSGEYKQGQRRLCYQRKGGDEFCCLGVAANILVLDGYGKWLLKHKAALYDGGNGSFPAAAYLTGTAPDWVKRRLKSVKGRVGTEIEDRLVCMNDGRGKTFAEIADWIEANL